MIRRIKMGRSREFPVSGAAEGAPAIRATDAHGARDHTRLPECPLEFERLIRTRIDYR